MAGCCWSVIFWSSNLSDQNFSRNRSDHHQHHLPSLPIVTLQYYTTTSNSKLFGANPSGQLLGHHQENYKQEFLIHIEWRRRIWYICFRYYSQYIWLRSFFEPRELTIVKYPIKADFILGRPVASNVVLNAHKKYLILKFRNVLQTNIRHVL